MSDAWTSLFDQAKLLASLRSNTRSSRRESLICMPHDSTRDRVRALVREVLSGSSAGPKPTEPPPSRFINMTPTPMDQAIATRDESSKSMITEDDVRGLEPGSVLRIAETARLTPLAADIVSEKKIEIVRRVPRHGSKSSRLIAVGADHGGFKMKEDLRNFLTELGHRVHDLRNLL